MKIDIYEPSDIDAEWKSLRKELWPDCPIDKHDDEMTMRLNNDNCIVFIAKNAANDAIGLIEGCVRLSAEDCITSPVGYVEGWYVHPSFRNQGIGKSLMSKLEMWFLNQDCTEMASDTAIGNHISLKAHLAVGFIESSRLIHFKKRINKQRLYL